MLPSHSTWELFVDAFKVVENTGQTVGRVYANCDMIQGFVDEGGAIHLAPRFRNSPLPDNTRVGLLWTAGLCTDNTLSAPLAFPKTPEGCLSVVRERRLCPA